MTPDELRQALLRAGAVVHPPAGLPILGSAHHRLPPDLADWYTLAGGFDLWPEKARGFHLSSARQLVPMETTLHGSALDPTDRAQDWYLLGATRDGEPVAIDLHPDRLGRIYDASMGAYANPGYSAIIARSFSEFVERLLGATSKIPYWMEGFVPYGDAYDP